jgi:hypothetical protein
MSPDEKKALIEKIDRLSPEQRKRVEGYVDALREMAQPSSAAEEFSLGSEKEGKAREPSSSAQSTDTEKETLSLSLRGALRHLKGEYMAEELQEEAKQWRIKKALDY